MDEVTNKFPDNAIPLPANDPERLAFRTGEITGGGQADGKPILCMTVMPVCDPVTGGGPPMPVVVIFSRESAHKVAKAILEFMSMDPYALPPESTDEETKCQE